MASKRWIGVWWLVIVALIGCEKKKLPTPPEADTAGIAQAEADAGTAVAKPRIVRDEGPMPTADTPIATAGEFKVTVGDFEDASKISLLFAPDGQTTMAPERLALPHVHVTMARSLLSQKVIAAELEKRGIKPSTEELHAYLRDHPRLRKFGQHIDNPEELARSLAPLGLESKHLLRVAWDELGNKMLASALIAEISDEEIWKTYAFQNTTRTAAIAEGRNIPTSEEIDDWMGAHADEIDAHFQANQRKYRTPRRVRLNIVKPAPGESITLEKLKKAAELLGKGVQPATAAKELGVQHEIDTLLVRGENPRAFAMKPGEVGWTDGGARGAYAWKVVGFEASRAPEMSRPLRREITAELMRTTQVVPSVAAKLEKAAKILDKQKLGDRAKLQTDELEAALRDEIEALGLSFLVATFPHNPRGPLPEYGLAEEVVSKAFELDAGATSEPFLSRERGFVLRVLATHEPDREQFDQNIDENRKAFYAATQPRIVTQWVEQRLAELDAQLDLKPLRIKFGVLQKDSDGRR